MMNSKAALKELWQSDICNKCNTGDSACNICKNLILNELERIEHIEKGTQVLINKSLELSNKLTKYKEALKLIKDYLTIANDVPLMTFAERCFTEEEVTLLKEVLEENV